MKTGMTLPALAAQLERGRTERQDLIVPTKKVTAYVTEETMRLNIDDRFHLGLNEVSRQQLANWTQIPAQYWDRMPPELLAHNVNHWLNASDDKRFVRTYPDLARAWLSPRYRPLDNDDVAEAIFPALAEIPDIRIESCSVTDRKFYLKAITPRLEGEVRKGDVVQAGICISNSETGCGAFTVQPLLYRLICLNGMIVNDLAKRARHVGRQIEGEYEEIYDADTREADNRALLLKMRDHVRHAVSDAGFQQMLAKLTTLPEQRIEGHPEAAVEILANSIHLNQTERTGVLRHLIDGGDLSRWGMLNAVTRASQDVDSYDRATELERLGWSIAEMPKADWRQIATAEA